MGSCGAIPRDRIQWQENDIITFFMPNKRGKENADFSAVAEEVKSLLN